MQQHSDEALRRLKKLSDKMNLLLNSTYFHYSNCHLCLHQKKCSHKWWVVTNLIINPSTCKSQQGISTQTKIIVFKSTWYESWLFLVIAIWFRKQLKFHFDQAWITRQSPNTYKQAILDLAESSFVVPPFPQAVSDLALMMPSSVWPCAPGISLDTVRHCSEITSYPPLFNGSNTLSVSFHFSL